MKITTRRDALFAQLQTVTRAASTRSAVQALSGVQVLATGGAIELRATDMEIGLRVPLEGEIVREGSVVLPARLRRRRRPGAARRRRLARAAPDRAGRGDRRRLRDLPHPHAALGGLPAVPGARGRSRRWSPATAFVATVNKVARSASRDETRPVLTGILVSATGDELRMVATDSYRLSVKETKLESAAGRRLRGQRAGAGAAGADPDRPARERRELAVSVRANQVVFEAGGVVLSSRLIDGQFPNYRQLLPDAYEHELRLAGGEISEVVRRISLLAQKNAPLRLAFTEGELTVSARTPDVGEARETMPVPFAGEPLEIGFNPEFLRDGLEAIEGGDVVLKLISPLRPGLIEAGDGSGFQYLLMPIRLNV